MSDEQALAATETTPEPDPASDPAPTAERRSTRALWATAVLATAGVGGFALAWFDPMDWRGGAKITTLQTQVAALTAQLAKLEASAPDSALSGRLTTVESKLAALSQAPVDGAVSAVAFAALQKDVTGLQTSLAGAATSGGGVTDAALRAAVDQAMTDWTAAEARRTQAQLTEAQTKQARLAALAVIRAAALTGAPYADSLSALDGIAVPEPLARHATVGLPTLSALAEAFPESARAALDASLRKSADGSWSARLLGFLRVQTGARSLEPREGNDPDAVLSRAEAAVSAADVAKALTELAALPPEGQAKMQPWVDQANEYQASQQALAALAATLGQ